jgi:hypothetical protein
MQPRKEKFFTLFSKDSTVVESAAILSWSRRRAE